MEYIFNYDFIIATMAELLSPYDLCQFRLITTTTFKLITNDLIYNLILNYATCELKNIFGQHYDKLLRIMEKRKIILTGSFIMGHVHGMNWLNKLIFRINLANIGDHNSNIINDFNAMNCDVDYDKIMDWLRIYHGHNLLLKTIETFVYWARVIPFKNFNIKLHLCEQSMNYGVIHCGQIWVCDGKLKLSFKDDIMKMQQIINLANNYYNLEQIIKDCKFYLIPVTVLELGLFMYSYGKQYPVVVYAEDKISVAGCLVRRTQNKILKTDLVQVKNNSFKQICINTDIIIRGHKCPFIQLCPDVFHFHGHVYGLNNFCTIQVIYFKYDKNRSLFNPYKKLFDCDLGYSDVLDLPTMNI